MAPNGALNYDIINAEMHAYLVLGQNSKAIGQIDKLAKELKAKILEFPIVKIEDTRNLNSLIRLSFEEPTLIVCQNIQEATEEALNALLKNLEEPQENIYFALTAPSIRKVLPTITSRCQIIRSVNEVESGSNDEEIDNFLSLTTGKKLAYTDKIKDRHDALELVESTVNLLHSKLHGDQVKYTQVVSNIEVAEKTLTRLKGNGNVNLQLTNFCINLK